MEFTPENVQSLIDQYTPVAIGFGGNFIAAVLTLIIGLWLAGWACRMLSHLLERTGRVDTTLTTFLGSMVRYLIITFTVIAILGRFGVQTASLVALLGALGLAIGLSLQGTLSDVAAGVLLLFFRPFKVGEVVDIGGISGAVKAVTLFNCELATPDNRKILIPNGKVWGNPIINFSAHETRRVDLVFGISYEDSIDKAMDAIRACITADERCLKDPESVIIVTALADSSVNIGARIWVKTADYLTVQSDMLKAVKLRFDADGITIPYPHVYQLNKNLD